MLRPQSSVRRSRTLRSRTLDTRRSTLGMPANTLNQRKTWLRLQRHGTPAASQTSCFQGNGMCSSHSHFEPPQRGQSLRASFLMRKADSAQSMKLWVAMPIDAGTELRFLAPRPGLEVERSENPGRLPWPGSGPGGCGSFSALQEAHVIPPRGRRCSSQGEPSTDGMQESSTWCRRGDSNARHAGVCGALLA